MSKGKSVAAAVVVGAAAGYVAGILTAPKSGKETREDLKKASEKFKKDAALKLQEAKAELSTLIDQANVKVKDLSDKGKKELDELVVKAKAAQAKATEVFSAVKSGEAEDKDLQKALNDAKSAKNHLSGFLKQK
jgi:gas vesicle protein